MKKFISGILIAAMLTSVLCACNNGENQSGILAAYGIAAASGKTKYVCTDSRFIVYEIGYFLQIVKKQMCIRDRVARGSERVISAVCKVVERVKKSSVEIEYKRVNHFKQSFVL